MPPLEARALSRRFGGRVAVVEVSFTVDAGEVVGLLGPNGAGKTTTMRMLLGLLRPHGGEATRPAAVGYLPERFSACDGLTARGYLRFMARVKNVDRSEIDEAAARAGATDLLRRPVARLSKGQRQRIGLAQALLGRPEAYVLDEPMQGLDPRQIAETRARVRELAVEQGAAVLFSTHVLAEAAEVCDRVVVLAGGRVVADERPGESADLEERFLRAVGEAELS